MLISYSIRDKSALNELIYLQLPPDSLASCLSDAFSNTSAGKRVVVLEVGGAYWCCDAEARWWLVRLVRRGVVG